MKLKNNGALGRHLVAEFFECLPEALDDIDFVVQTMREAAVIAGATIVDTSFHRFLPHGISGVVVIAESHLTIHTWPEYEYAAIDLFTCGDEVHPWKAFDYLRKKLKSSRTDVTEHSRGKYSDIGVPEGSPHKIAT